jgi:predicted MPP superfamily phosphohydrolase
MNRRAWLKQQALVAAGMLIPGAAGQAVGMRMTVERYRRVVPGLVSPWRLLWMSDWHLPRSPGPVDAAIAMAHDLAPDVVVFGGDMIEGRRTWPAVQERLRAVRGHVATLALIGNWEYAGGWTPETWRAALGTCDITLLCNERLSVGGMDLIGLDDAREGTPRWPSLSGESPPRPEVWLAHEPVTWRRLGAGPGRAHALLALSGHTHGGQIGLLGFAPVLPEGSDGYVRGLYPASADRPELIVSAGVGQSTIAWRWGVAPDFVVVDFVPPLEDVPQRV